MALWRWTRRWGVNRTIKVTVVGDEKPRTYNVSSLWLRFSMPYVSRTSGMGSLRNIQLLRNNRGDTET
ncbi:MAG: hypothetical protein IPH28_20930 [Cytophagaceae bacterium]|nr:hypothetical protein [Cytophagaceae bacterium]